MDNQLRLMFTLLGQEFQATIEVHFEVLSTLGLTKRVYEDHKKRYLHKITYNLRTGELDLSSWDESYHNGSAFNNLHSKLKLTKSKQRAFEYILRDIYREEAFEAFKEKYLKAKFEEFLNGSL